MLCPLAPMQDLVLALHNWLGGISVFVRTTRLLASSMGAHNSLGICPSGLDFFKAEFIVVEMFP